MQVPRVLVLVALSAALLGLILVSAEPFDAGDLLASQLGLTDPRAASHAIAALRGQNIPNEGQVARVVLPAFIKERHNIQLALANRDHHNAVRRAQALIKQVEDLEDDRIEVVVFLQSLYIMKIQAEAMGRKFIQALYDGAKFRSHCEKLASGCPQLYQVNQATQPIETWLEKQAKPHEVLGLSDAEAHDGKKVKAAHRQAQLLLHPDKNMILSEEARKYVASLFDKASKARAQLLD